MTSPLPARLQAIRAQLEAATPGPWEAYDANESEWPPRPMWCVANDAFHNPPEDEDAPWLAVEVHTGVKEDAVFIASAPVTVARLLAAVEAVVKVHEPIDAAMYSGAQQRMVQVCTGCGTDDGNWQRYPCPTVRALTAALGDER